MNNIFQIGPQIKLKEIVRSIVLSHIKFKTEEEISAKYELMSEVLEECQITKVVQDLLEKVVKSYNLSGNDSEASKILPSLIRTLLEEVTQEKDTSVKETTSELPLQIEPT